MTIPEFKVDVFIDGKKARNRALDGNTVVLKFLEKSKWTRMENGQLRPLGEVVHVSSSSEGSTYSGVLAWNAKELQEQVQTDSSLSMCFDKDLYIIFNPTSSKVPFMRVARKTLPDFIGDLGRTGSSGQLFMARIESWTADSQFPVGVITKHVGAVGMVEPETEALLLQNQVDFSEFSQAVLSCLPATPWCPPQEEILARRDFRKHRVFSIDPATARDLDDALSCVQ